MSQVNKQLLDEFATLEAFCLDGEVPMKDQVVSLKKMKRILLGNKDIPEFDDLNERYEFAFDSVYLK